MTTHSPRPDAACSAFELAVQAVLDRQAGPDLLEGDHPAGCPRCRELAGATKLLLRGLPSGPPSPPPDLADRIVAVAIRDHQLRGKRRFVARLAGAALVATVLLGGLLLARRTPERDLAQQMPPLSQPEPASAPPPEAPPPRVYEHVSEATSAVATLTRKATDQAVSPTRSLIPPPEAVALPMSDLLPEAEPAVDSLAGMPEAARSGLEPVTEKTRRAVGLFLRDFGMSPSAKPNL